MAKRRIARKRRTRRVKAKRGPNMFTKKVRAVIARQAETKSVVQFLEQEITPSLNLLVRGYLTGIQNSLQAGAINARIGNEVYTKRQTFNWVFKTSVAVAFGIASCFV